MPEPRWKNMFLSENAMIGGWVGIEKSASAENRMKWFWYKFHVITIRLCSRVCMWAKENKIQSSLSEGLQISTCCWSWFFVMLWLVEKAKVVSSKIPITRNWNKQDAEGCRTWQVNTYSEWLERGPEKHNYVCKNQRVRVLGDAYWRKHAGRCISRKETKVYWLIICGLLFYGLPAVLRESS